MGTVGFSISTFESFKYTVDVATSEHPELNSTIFASEKMVGFCLVGTGASPTKYSIEPSRSPNAPTGVTRPDISFARMPGGNADVLFFMIGTLSRERLAERQRVIYSDKLAGNVHK
jgi:hypothetical protein